MAPNSPSITLSPRYYHPAMLDAAHLSVKAAILIAVIVILTLLIGCFWCYCCCRRRRRRVKKRAQNLLKGPQPNTDRRRFRLPGWMLRKGGSNVAAERNVDEAGLPRYSSLEDVDLEDIVMPKKVQKKGWKNADLY